ncbi:MAG: fumarylacetoacetate hydrolase family protein [Anaerolineales bacterium]
MKFVTYSASGTTARPGLLTEDGILPLPYDSMLDLIHASDKGLDTARNAPRENLLPLNEARLHAPIPRPPTLRDFYAFEQHVRTANQNRGREVPENWYKFPVFYFTNPNSIFGPEEEVPYPPYTQALDYELEIAAVIGKAGVNISPEEAPKHIFGYTIFNDWSARDVQRTEMKVALGPAKGKDFASSLGPVIATADEFATGLLSKPGVYEAAMVARVNGEERSRGNFKDIYWSFGQIIARASESVMLYPGDVIGSGTVGTGCLLELTKGQGPWLQPGDTVELDIEGIGVLRNSVSLRKS